jgi:hypothetical protein
MATAIGINETFSQGLGRPYVLAFCIILFTGAPATEAVIRLFTKK